MRDVPELASVRMTADVLAETEGRNSNGASAQFRRSAPVPALVYRSTPKAGRFGQALDLTTIDRIARLDNPASDFVRLTKKLAGKKIRLPARGVHL